MGSYLENYIESVSSLPQEVRRNFQLLRELDAESQELVENVERASKSYLRNAKRTREVSEAEEATIKADLKKALELGDEKVALAVQTYDLVDRHIRRLDQDLKKFEQELAEAGQQKGLTDKSKSESGKNKGRKTGHETLLTEDARIRVQQDMDMPIDPNEPTYCFCHRVSFGEMVGCDNADCKIEWFHFECVGLTNPPKGKWHCPDCTALMKQKHS
eukprot:TRINITY_DN931_c0_g1_i1.p1 TRINITY_DN931_c0_g1~~TRINITY_DN931_c0_g1_i1.p1  ORF type:complete len:216 (+),score=55.55 TRINITY_DN931_c0_g1_i1:838-1485(+)